jgi:hypothetical protein
MAQPLFQATAGFDLPPFEAAVDAYRLLKWRQGTNRHFKRRFVAISANVESDYLFCRGWIASNFPSLMAQLLISAEGWNLFIYFLIILQNYTMVPKFYSFDNQSSWATAAFVAHGDFWSNRRGPRQFGKCHGPRRLQYPHGSR